MMSKLSRLILITEYHACLDMLAKIGLIYDKISLPELEAMSDVQLTNLVTRLRRFARTPIHVC